MDDHFREQHLPTLSTSSTRQYVNIVLPKHTLNGKSNADLEHDNLNPNGTDQQIIDERDDFSACGSKSSFGSIKSGVSSKFTCIFSIS